MNTSLIKENLRQLRSLDRLLVKLDDQTFTTPITALDQATIGMHVRHVLEFYSCLRQGLRDNVVCYDNRAREIKLETVVAFARETITEVADFISAVIDDQQITLCASFTAKKDDRILVNSCLQRELIYNLEHTIHHMAIIGIAVRLLGKPEFLEDGFGVAPSTLRKYQACAQ